MQFLLALLLLLDLDSPEALDTFCLVGAGGVVVAFVRIAFGDTESEEGHREKLEGVFKGGAVSDLGEELVFLARLFVRGGLEGAEGSFDCLLLLALATSGIGGRSLPLNISFRCPLRMHVLIFRS
jgi:hypothetical protein